MRIPSVSQARHIGMRLTKALAGFTLAFGTTAAMASLRSTLKPEKVAQLRASNQSYLQCRKDAIAAFKAKTIDHTGFKKKLETCKEKFPASELYVACKRRLASDAKTRSIDVMARKTQCLKLLVASTFDPDRPFPAYVRDRGLYFGGVGLNRPLSLTGESDELLPGYDCQRLYSASAKPANAEYFLFGSHPRDFGELDGVSDKELKHLLHYSFRQSRNGQLVKGFGKVYGNPAHPDSSVFFPTAPCLYAGNSGKFFEGLKTYYLLDSRQHSATPYFGVAFYREDARGITTSELIRKLEATLGPDYKVIAKDKSVSFVTDEALTDFDGEGDPRDLCAKSRRRPFIAIVKSRDGKPSQPEYFLLANVKNLCEYGDRLSTRVGK